MDSLRARRLATFRHAAILSPPTWASLHWRKTVSVCGPWQRPRTSMPRSIASETAARTGPRRHDHGGNHQPLARDFNRLDDILDDGGAFARSECNGDRHATHLCGAGIAIAR